MTNSTLGNVVHEKLQFSGITEFPRDILLTREPNNFILSPQDFVTHTELTEVIL